MKVFKIKFSQIIAKLRIMANIASSKNKCGNIKHLAISNIQSVTMEKAPLIKVCINSANGFYELEVLPDSGTDILTIGQ